MAGLAEGQEIIIEASMSNASYKGEPGKSAYELAVEQGFEGNLEAWLNSLKGQGLPGATGPAGPQGQAGLNGKSAYQLAVDLGYEGSITDWLESLRGEGTPGAAGADGYGIYWCTYNLSDDYAAFNIAANTTYFPSGIPDQVGDLVITQNGWLGSCTSIGANIRVVPRFALLGESQAITNLEIENIIMEV